MKLGWGLIGCGDIANKAVCPAINNCSEAELIAVMCRNAKWAKECAHRHGAKRSYHSIEALLNDDDVKAVYVASEVYRHCPETVAAATARKHVLCEKPMALNTEECRRMIAACREAGVNLQIAYYRRYYPKSQKMKEILESGALGTIIRAATTLYGRFDPKPDDFKRWRVEFSKSGGGAIADSGSHRLDLMSYLLGDPVELIAFADRQIMSYDVPDCETLIIKCANGAHFVGCYNWNLPVGRDDFEVHGEHGSLLASPLDQPSLTVVVDRHSETFDLPRATNTHQPLIDDFTRRMLRGDPPQFAGEDGMKATAIITAAYESASTGRSVKLPRAER